MTGPSSQPQPKIFDFNNHQVRTLKQHFYFASTSFSFSALKCFQQLAEEADIIHYHFPWPFMDFLHLACKINKPTVVTYHSDIVKQKGLFQVYKPIMHRFLNDVDKIIVTSPQYLDSSAVLKKYLEKIDVIPLGISKEECIPKTETIQKWRLKLGEGFFLFLGALRYYKGLHILIEAARKTKLPIVIAGTGDQEKYLKANAPKNVIFTGHYSNDDRAALLSVARGFVFPSHQRSEAFGISLLEAARASVPIISCEINTGTTFVNQHNITGLVIKPSNSDELASAMQQFYENPDMLVKFSQAARIRFETLFTSDQMAESYANVYNELLIRP